MRRLLAVSLIALALSGIVHAEQKWALLIGVNEYRVDRWKLKGCVNDVLMTKELLTTKFGFPEENVKVLLDEDATADNIRQGLEEWLIAKSKPEDIVYFHFSGHGAQIPDRDGDEEDGQDEFLCAVNLNPKDHTTLVTDDQLKDLFDRIPSKNVTIVTDCCHSGTGTRDISLNRKRAIDSYDLEHFSLEEEGDGGTRAVVMTPTGGGGTKPPKPPPPPAAPPKPPLENQAVSQAGVDMGDKLQVHISGCRDEQTSADAWIRDDFYAGALTFHWVENLKKAPANISYRDLIERVRRDLKAKKYTQLPQINGSADRPIFGKPIAGTVSVPFVVVKSVQGDRVTLSGGQAQNMTTGSVYAVFPEGEVTFAGEGMGRIKISRVDPTSAEAMKLGGVAVRPGFRAKQVLHNQEMTKLKLKVEGASAGVQSAVASALGRLDFVEVVDEGKHFHQRLQLSEAAGGLHAALTIDMVPGLRVEAADAASLVIALESQLQSSYAINFLSSLSNDNPPFGVEVWANKSSAGTRDLMVAELEEAEDEKYMQAKLGDVLRFHFQAEEDCYLALINVGTSGKVNVLFPNKLYPDGRVVGGQEYRTRSFKGDKAAQIPLTIKLDPKGKAGREFVQVIASREPIDFAALKGKMGSQFAQAMTRDLIVEEESEADENLMPTDQWATDFLFIETYK
jgi:metacaspase-1